MKASSMKLTVSTEEPQMEPAAPVERWGKDHWSTLAYIETRIVDHKGEPNREQMRCDVAIHPQFANRANRGLLPDKKYPTRLNDGTELPGHDDWSCMDDAEAVGFVVNNGTGLHRVYALTDAGTEVCNALREHKRKGGNFGEFRV